MDVQQGAGIGARQCHKLLGRGSGLGPTPRGEQGSA